MEAGRLPIVVLAVVDAAWFRGDGCRSAARVARWSAAALGSGVDGRVVANARRTGLAGNVVAAVVAMIPSARFVGGPAGVDGWVASFGALGGHVHQVDAIGDVAAAVDAAVAGRAPVLVGADPLVRSAGVRGDMQWPDCGIDGAATAAVGVVGVIA